ncbi:MAG: hypothetical protein LLG24_03680 [Actinomycetia bacterium]|nr:hypothetical protein [Actinomycetes bacterium]
MHADQPLPVKAKALLLAADSDRVVWMNEAASESMSRHWRQGERPSLEEAFSMAGPLGLADAVRQVRATGEAVHAQSRVISTRKGAMVVAASVYRLPDGAVLVVSETTFRMGEKG